MYFTYMTGTEWPLKEDSAASDDDFLFDYSKPPTKYRFLSNCEFYPYDQHLFPASSATNSTNSSPIVSKELEGGCKTCGSK
jgi:hypothetical protein